MRCRTLGTTICFLNKSFKINNGEICIYHLEKQGNIHLYRYTSISIYNIDIYISISLSLLKTLLSTCGPQSPVMNLFWCVSSSLLPPFFFWFWFIEISSHYLTYFIQHLNKSFSHLNLFCHLEYYTQTSI